MKLKMTANFKHSAAVGISVAVMVFLAELSFGIVILPMAPMIGLATGILDDLFRRIRGPEKEVP